MESKIEFIPQPTRPDKRHIMIGYLWSIETKKDVKALPSMNEIFYGLYLYIAQLLEQKLLAANQKLIWIEACKERYKKVFDYIL